MNNKSNIFDLLVGILMLVVGILIWLNPTITLKLFSVFMGTAFIATGILHTASYFRTRYTSHLTYAILDMLIGIFLMTNVGLIAMSLPIILAFWILFNSLIQLTNAVDYKKFGFSFWKYNLVISIFGILAALIILVHPTIGALTISIVVGSYAVVFGLVEIYDYYLLKNADKK